MEEDSKYLTKDDFKKFISARKLFKPGKNRHDYNNSIWLFNQKDKFLIVQKVGKCNPEKCNSACCKFCSAGYVTDYSKGFFEEDEFGGDILKVKCNNLKKDGKCKLWGRKLPNACKQFPHPSDSIYWNVVDKCTFKYKILYIIHKNSTITRKEMLKCFSEQF